MKFIEKVISLIFNQTTILVTMIVVQLLAFVFVWIIFSNYFVYFYLFCVILSVVSVGLIVMKEGSSEAKIPLLIFICLAPLFGGPFYYLFISKLRFRRLWKRMYRAERYHKVVTQQQTDIIKKLRMNHPTSAKQATYLFDMSAAPIHQNTDIQYLSLGEIKYEYLLCELKKAKHFIFLEYFIIAPGVMWDAILAILIEKVAAGVDVRVMYDAMGTLGILPSTYYKELRKLGISAYVFNPIEFRVSSKINSRNHRKICVIDGVVGFTGGINIGDEYINYYPKLGHWKDTAVMLHGDAVWNLTTFFLSTWEFVSGTRENYELYRPESKFISAASGYVIPYADSPLDTEYVGENLYIQLIMQATKYVYIMTPYLIIGQEMLRVLKIAALTGVDVRIMMPKVGDRWYIQVMTRSYYRSLIEAGIKIYEYTPGFIHAKSVVIDDKIATVGTVNMDFRSFALNFECGVWVQGSDVVYDVRDDFRQMEHSCQLITLEDAKYFSRKYCILLPFLRIFVALM